METLKIGLPEKPKQPKQTEAILLIGTQPEKALTDDTSPQSEPKPKEKIVVFDSAWTELCMRP